MTLHPFAHKSHSKVLQADILLNSVKENLDYKNALELCGFNPADDKNLPTMAELMAEFPLLVGATIVRQGSKQK